jgi:hypothetical protein
MMKNYDINQYEDDEIFVKILQRRRKIRRINRWTMSVNEALILQQVYEGGIDDVDNIVD